MQEHQTLTLAKFREYPFRLLPGEKVTIWAGYADVRDKLLELVQSPRSDQIGLYEFAIVWGELGAGKSHALRYFKHLIAEEQSDIFKSPVAYIDTLKLESKSDFISIYKAAMALLEPSLREAGRAIDRAINLKVTEEWEKTDASLLTQPEFRERMGKKMLDELCPTFPALAHLLYAVKGDDHLALSILKGNRHRPEELKKYGLTNSIESEYEAVRCFGQFVNLVTNPIMGSAAPFKAVYLFLDELEVIMDFKPEQILSINQGIRDLLNACPEHFCLLCGFTGSIESLEAFLEASVIQRLSRDPIEIPALDNTQSVDFLTQVLTQYHSDASVPPEYPFTRDALNEIAAKTTIKTPRNLFKGSRIVLERAVLDGKLTVGGTIDTDTVSAYLE